MTGCCLSAHPPAFGPWISLPVRSPEFHVTRAGRCRPLPPPLAPRLACVARVGRRGASVARTHCSCLRPRLPMAVCPFPWTPAAVRKAAARGLFLGRMFCCLKVRRRAGRFVSLRARRGRLAAGGVCVLRPAAPAVFSRACRPFRRLGGPVQGRFCCLPSCAGSLCVQPGSPVRACVANLAPGATFGERSVLERGGDAPVSGILCARLFPGAASHVCDSFGCPAGASAVHCRIMGSLGQTRSGRCREAGRAGRAGARSLVCRVKALWAAVLGVAVSWAPCGLGPSTTAG